MWPLFVVTKFLFKAISIAIESDHERKVRLKEEEDFDRDVGRLYKLSMVVYSIMYWMYFLGKLKEGEIASALFSAFLIFMVTVWFAPFVIFLVIAWIVLFGK